MGGGEKTPMGSQLKQTDDVTQFGAKAGTLSISSQLPNGSRNNLQRRIRKLGKAIKRDISWANTPEKCKREFAVRHMYPRMLYTFSDIVVFVLRNDRSVFVS
jgi:hypothetical protein